ncbi:MAG: carboxypeptidase-like regulatory domain-containing protein [Candidatus Competibacteraceae bacterium]|nr:carboxypeptidase-like regulatory domain-containing protein [Candidatus Competibacteraceae bacterium]
MKYLLRLLHILIIFATFSSCYLWAQPKLVQVSGYVYQKDSSNTIPFVDIVNKKNKTGTITNVSGFFSFLMSTTDTIEFTAIGFKKYRFWLPSQIQETTYQTLILMEKVVYTLDQVDIGLFNYERFKKDFESMKVPVDDNSIVAGDPTYYKRYVAPKENFGYTIKGPFTALYNKFSRRAKELEKLQDILENENKNVTASMKLTKDLIVQVTGINDAEIDRFVGYCNMGSEFVANATTYDLMVAIDRCYKSYLADKDKKDK